MLLVRVNMLINAHIMCANGTLIMTTIYSANYRENSEFLRADERAFVYNLE